MSEDGFDETTAHRHFAAACFNRAWDFLDLPHRNDKQVEEMVHAAHASFWHWLHVPEQTPVNMSIGLWQLARVYAVAGLAEESRRWAHRCLEVGEAERLDPFYRAYAHEAFARAERVAGAAASAERHVAAARALLPAIEELDDRERLAKDLDSLAPPSTVSP
jgi:hypothetical protein